MDMDLFQPDDIPMQEGQNKLVCSCPKCSAKIEHELTALESNNATYKCSECKASYVITRETFARRASRHGGEINCSHCGGVLDHSQYCPTCKTLYPEYFAVERPDDVKKRARQNRDTFSWLKNFSFEWRTSSVSTTEYNPAMIDSEVWKEPVTSFWSKRKIIISAGTIILIALISLGTTLYVQVQAKKQYASTYMQALYGMKLGSDLGIKLSKQLAADWTAKVSSEQNSPPRLSVDDENQLNNIKNKTDNYLKKLTKPPTPYTDANERLLQLNTTYSKLHATIQNPVGSVASFIELTQKTENELLANTTNLKNSLPPELARELEVAKTKYKALGGI